MIKFASTRKFKLLKKSISTVLKFEETSFLKRNVPESLYPYIKLGNLY